MPLAKTIDIDSRWFKDKLRDRELPQRKLAKMLGLGTSAVSLMLSGKRRITIEEAADLSRLLGLPMDEVLEHAGVQPGEPAKSVPLVGEVDAEGELHPVKAGKRVPLKLTLPQNTVAVTCKDQNAPGYGWFWFFEPRTGVDADCVGRLCITELKTGQRYLRFLKPAKERGNYDLQGWFSVTVNNVKVKTASPILWIKT